MLPMRPLFQGLRAQVSRGKPIAVSVAAARIAPATAVVIESSLIGGKRDHASLSSGSVSSHTGRASSGWAKGSGAALTLAAATLALAGSLAISSKEASATPKTPETQPKIKNSQVSKFYIPPSLDSRIKLFTGNSNTNLANEIAMYLGVQLGRAVVRKFSDGEVNVTILDNVRGKDIFVVQSLSPPVNDNLIELLLIISTLRRASAGKITAVIPYYGYTRRVSSEVVSATRSSGGKGTQEDEEQSFEAPIAAADVATMLQVMGVDRVITVDLHHPQIQGFFDASIPADNLDVSGISIPFFAARNIKDPVVVSPDANGATRARSFRDKLFAHGYEKASLAIIVDAQEKPRGWEHEQKSNKNAPPKSPAGATEWSDEDINSIVLVGDVNGRDCIIFDDMVDSGRRVARASKKLKKKGAKRVFVFTTHGLFMGDSLSRIEDSEITEFVCTNTIPLPQHRAEGSVNAGNFSQKVQQLSVAPLLAEVILRIRDNKSVSEIFNPVPLSTPSSNNEKTSSVSSTVSAEANTPHQAQ